MGFSGLLTPIFIYFTSDPNFLEGVYIPGSTVSLALGKANVLVLSPAPILAAGVNGFVNFSALSGLYWPGPT